VLKVEVLQGPVPEDVLELARTHRAWTERESPPEDVHSVRAEELLDPLLTLVTARDDGGRLLGIGALRVLDGVHAEVKAMHVRAAAPGQGVGRALVLALVDLARQRQYRRLSLETGTQQAFASACALYAGAGFTVCPPFGQYVSSPNSVFMTLALVEQEH